MNWTKNSKSEINGNHKNSTPPDIVSELEKQVKKNAELYKDLFVEAIDGIVFWKDDTMIIDANESACRIFESSLEDLKNRRQSDFVYEKDEKFLQIGEELYSKGSVRGELLFLMPNGQKKYLEFTSKLYAIDGNHMTIYRNVTERHEMEQVLRERERIFSHIFEGASVGFVLWDEKLRVVDINLAGIKILQLKKEEMIGQEIPMIMGKLGGNMKEITQYIQNVKEIGKVYSEIKIILQSGEERELEYSTVHQVVSNLNLTIFRDTTEKRQLEEKLRKSDTLNVLGQLAAGIAHEIRNPMTALKGFIQLLEDTIKENHSMYYDVISRELERIDSIINEFLILSKPQSVQYSEKNIVEIMKETVNFLNAQAVLHDVQIEMNYDCHLPRVYCEPNQLKKVFINLIKNAIEVMHNGGKIAISIYKYGTDRIHISIQDEGSGIAPEKLQRLGEPFYTTKEKGTGLGLMVSYRIIGEHNGEVEVESEIGKGTTFHIYLPLHSLVS